MNIILNSDVLTISKIIKKSSAKMFEDLKVGDRLKLSIEVERSGRGPNGIYASYIKVENVDTGAYALKSFNQIESALSCFELIK
jgi:hypothetical protein